MSPVPSRNPNRGNSLSFEEMLALVRRGFPSVEPASAPNGARWLSVEPGILRELAILLRTDPSLRFDSLCCLSGVDLLRFPAAAGQEDRPEGLLQCVYDLHSPEIGHELRVKVSVPRERARVPSVESVWGVAGFFEREVFDLLGIEFEGHHDLRRILMPPDWAGHPLRKDYAYPTAYSGWELKREGQTFESGPYK